MAHASSCPPKSVAEMERSRAQIVKLAGSGRAVYGVSTGFGALATKYIEPEMRGQLQRSLHPLPMPPAAASVSRARSVRALMLLRLSTLATGRTGVRVSRDPAAAYADCLNAHITPRGVPEFGSLGCSGDLAPLAHCALALHGRGRGLRLRRQAHAGGSGACGIWPGADRARREGGAAPPTAPTGCSA